MIYNWYKDLNYITFYFPRINYNILPFILWTMDLVIKKQCLLEKEKIKPQAWESLHWLFQSQTAYLPFNSKICFLHFIIGGSN